jgi:hypothetical protein
MKQWINFIICLFITQSNLVASRELSELEVEKARAERAALFQDNHEAVRVMNEEAKIAKKDRWGLLQGALAFDLGKVINILKEDQNIPSEVLFNALRAASNDGVQEYIDDENGKPAMLGTSKANFFPIAAALIERDPKILNMYPFLALAAKRGDQEAFKFFLELNASIDKQNHLGRTALFEAAAPATAGISKTASENIFKLLLNAGANPYIKDNEGHLFTYFARPVIMKIWHEFQKEQQDKINKMREALSEHRQQLPAEDTATPQHLTPDLLKIIDQYYHHQEPTK